MSIQDTKWFYQKLAEKDAKIESLKSRLRELIEWCEGDEYSITEYGKEILESAREAME